MKSFLAISSFVLLILSLTGPSFDNLEFKASFGDSVSDRSAPSKALVPVESEVVDLIEEEPVNKSPLKKIGFLKPSLELTSILRIQKISLTYRKRFLVNASYNPNRPRSPPLDI